MDVGPVFVSGAQPLEGVQPGEAAFDDPALFAQSGAVGDPAAGDARGDAAGAQLAAVLVVVVAAVGEQFPRAPAGAASPAAGRWHGGDPRGPLGGGGAGAAGESDGERDPAGVADQMVLGAGAAPVDRGRPDVVP